VSLCRDEQLRRPGQAVEERPNPSSNAACSLPVRRWVFVVPQAISRLALPSLVSTPAGLMLVTGG